MCSVSELSNFFFMILWSTGKFWWEQRWMQGREQEYTFQEFQDWWNHPKNQILYKMGEQVNYVDYLIKTSNNTLTLIYVFKYVKEAYSDVGIKMMIIALNS